MITLEHLLWDDMASLLKPYLDGRTLAYNLAGTLCLDGEPVADCLIWTLEEFDLHREALKQAHEDAKVEIKRLDDDLAVGTTITVYGVTATKWPDGDWRADPLEKAAA